jgi:hypothetical protein
MIDLEFHRTLADIRLARVLQVPSTMTLGHAIEELAQGYGALVLTEPLRAMTATDAVRLVGSGVALDVPLYACDLAAPLVLAQSLPAEVGLHELLEVPDRCVIVIDVADDCTGRLTIAGTLTCLLTQPPWVQAFGLALHRTETTIVEVQP